MLNLAGRLGKPGNFLSADHAELEPLGKLTHARFNGHFPRAFRLSGLVALEYGGLGEFPHISGIVNRAKVFVDADQGAE